jgi:hypothetical protein
VIENTSGIVGFFGASSMERLQAEVAMTANMNRFKSIPIVRGTFDWRQSGWISRPSLTGRTLCASWT